MIVQAEGHVQDTVEVSSRQRRQVVTAQAGYWPRSGRLDVQRQRLGSKVYSAINCLQRENKLKKKGEQNVEVQQSCGYIDVLSVTWLAKRESGGRCWPCASWSVTQVGSTKRTKYSCRFLE
jgi:hypothetical protein